MGHITEDSYICQRKNCAFYNEEMLNNCQALRYTGRNTKRCSFFKTPQQQYEFNIKQQKRMERDVAYRATVMRYILPEGKK